LKAASLSLSSRAFGAVSLMLSDRLIASARSLRLPASPMPREALFPPLLTSHLFTYLFGVFFFPVEPKSFSTFPSSPAFFILPRFSCARLPLHPPFPGRLLRPFVLRCLAQAGSPFSFGSGSCFWLLCARHRSSCLPSSVMLLLPLFIGSKPITGAPIRASLCSPS